jgi:hypothetical protein
MSRDTETEGQRDRESGTVQGHNCSVPVIQTEGQ